MQTKKFPLQTRVILPASSLGELPNSGIKLWNFWAWIVTSYRIVSCSGNNGWKKRSLTHSSRFSKKWDRLPGKQVFCGPGNQNTKLINKGDPEITQARRAMELQWQVTQSGPRDWHKTFDARASKTTTKGLDWLSRRDTDVPWHRKTTTAEGINVTQQKAS